MNTEATLEMDLPQNVTDSNPLRIFLQAGQSECVGQADPSLLQADNTSYPDLVGPQDGVWLAGFYETAFLIRPMNVGEMTEDKFGPEISMGRRIADASDNASPILIVKYCWGGSNLRNQWNPEKSNNSWNRDEDDGSSEWLLQSNTVDLQDKTRLYANLIYTIRLTTETLEEASIPYEFSAFVWIQGSADKLRTWYEYGIDTIRFFETLRLDIDEPDLPIIDSGSSPHNNLKSGKVYAAENINNGNVYETSFAMVSLDPLSSCIPSPSIFCNDSFLNYDVFEHYGIDPAFNEPPYSDMLPENFTDVGEFYWFKNFPSDQHSEYEGMILNGRMYANAFVREFANWATLTPEMEADDPLILFPWEVCPEGELPNDDNICWIDERTEGPNFPTSPPSGEGIDSIFVIIWRQIKKFIARLLGIFA